MLRNDNMLKKDWYKIKVLKYLIFKFLKIYKQQFGNYYMQIDIGSRLVWDTKRGAWKYRWRSPILSSYIKLNETEKKTIIKKKENGTKEKKEWALEIKRTRIHSQNTHDELPRWFK